MMPVDVESNNETISNVTVVSCWAVMSVDVSYLALAD